MARKGWNALSPGYQARLKKAGISRSDYEEGQSIKAARGHAVTPERPSQANPNTHTAYVTERNRLISRIVQKKQGWFGTSPKWNPTRSMRPFKDNPPAMANLKRWADLSREEWLDALREDDTTTAFLGYH